MNNIFLFFELFGFIDIIKAKKYMIPIHRFLFLRDVENCQQKRNLKKRYQSYNFFCFALAIIFFL